MLKNLFKQIQEKAEDFKKTEDYKKLSEGAVKVKEKGIEYFNLAKKEVLNAKSELFDKDQESKEEVDLKDIKKEAVKPTVKENVKKQTVEKPKTTDEKSKSSSKKPVKESTKVLNDNSKRKMLSDTNLNKNIVSALNKENYIYLDQIEALTDEELSEVKGIGLKSVETIRGFLETYLESRRVNSKT